MIYPVRDSTFTPVLLELISPLNAELNPICHLLALLGAHHIFHVSRIRVNCRGDRLIWPTVNMPCRNVKLHHLSCSDKYIHCGKLLVGSVPNVLSEAAVHC
jgi:hypothetical protein